MQCFFDPPIANLHGLGLVILVALIMVALITGGLAAKERLTLRLIAVQAAAYTATVLGYIAWSQC